MGEMSLEIVLKTEVPDFRFSVSNVISYENFQLFDDRFLDRQNIFGKKHLVDKNFPLFVRFFGIFMNNPNRISILSGIEYSLFLIKWDLDKMGIWSNLVQKKIADLFSIKREFDKTGRFSGIFSKSEVKQ